MELKILFLALLAVACSSEQIQKEEWSDEANSVGSIESETKQPPSSVETETGEQDSKQNPSDKLQTSETHGFNNVFGFHHQPFGIHTHGHYYSPVPIFYGQKYLHDSGFYYAHAFPYMLYGWYPKYKHIAYGHIMHAPLHYPGHVGMGFYPFGVPIPPFPHHHHFGVGPVLPMPYGLHKPMVPYPLKVHYHG